MWRGKIPDPKRSRSNREAPAAIISIAQQASPNVMGHSEDFRAQLKTPSTVVVITPGGGPSFDQAHLSAPFFKT